MNDHPARRRIRQEARNARAARRAPVPDPQPQDEQQPTEPQEQK